MVLPELVRVAGLGSERKQANLESSVAPFDERLNEIHPHLLGAGVSATDGGGTFPIGHLQGPDFFGATMSANQTAAPPAQPSLVLLYGNSNMAKKRWPIQRDSLIIGKSRGCDLILEAGDISNLHCVITRNAGGFSIRDCNSRAGIKLNGDKIQESTLYDGAIIQVGPFCFRIDIPTVRKNLDQPNAEPRHLRLDRKRRNLARLAIALRKRIRHFETNGIGNGNGQGMSRSPTHEEHRALDARREALAAREAELERRIQEANDRARDLDAAEAEIKLERAAFERDVTEFRDLVAKKEAQLADREIDLGELQTTHKAEFDKALAERRKNFERELQEHREDVDEEIARIRHEFEKECQQRRDALHQELAAKREQAEEEIAQRLAQAASASQDYEEDVESTRISPVRQDADEDLGKTMSCVPDSEELGQTMLFSPAENGTGVNAEELKKLATRQQELEAFGRHLRQMRDELQKERSRLEIAHQNLTRGVLEMQMEQKEHMLTREQWAQEHAEAAERLQRQRQAVAEAEAELREQREHIKRMTEELKAAQDRVRQQGSEEMEALRQENIELRQLIQEFRDHMASSGHGADEELREDLEKAQKAISILRKAVEEKDSEIERLQNRLKADEPPVIEDVDSYEAELVQFRRQLEADRAKLNEDLQALRQRNEELEDATREIEMELSRERADMARERTRLDRLREEVQADMQRLEQNAQIRGQMAPVQKLREEINEKRSNGKETPPPQQDSGLMNGLRNLRNRLGGK